MLKSKLYCFIIAVNLYDAVYLRANDPDIQTTVDPNKNPPYVDSFVNKHSVLTKNVSNVRWQPIVISVSNEFV